MTSNPRNMPTPGGKYHQGWKATQPATPERPFHVRAQFTAEKILEKARAMMDFAFRLREFQAELMRGAQQLNDEARALSRIAQAESVREKAKEDKN